MLNIDLKSANTTALTKNPTLDQINAFRAGDAPLRSNSTSDQLSDGANKIKLDDSVEGPSGSIHVTASASVETSSCFSGQPWRCRCQHTTASPAPATTCNRT